MVASTLTRANAAQLPYATGSIQMAVTSPPYFGKVLYGDSDQEHGLTSLEEYLADMVAMATEVHRVTDRDAVFWFNIGDTMANSGGAGGDHARDGRKSWKPKYKQGHTGLKGNQHILVPQRLALAFQASGWWVKRWIIWNKAPKVRPEAIAHVRRPLDQHEIILMLVKHKGYRYRPRAHAAFGIELGDVWHFSPVTTKTGHPAPYPEEIPRRAVLLSTAPGDRVLDPYVGSGTTITVADAHGRIGVGADLYAGVNP